jgi:hypothetical protein
MILAVGMYPYNPAKELMVVVGFMKQCNVYHVVLRHLLPIVMVNLVVCGMMDLVKMIVVVTNQHHKPAPILITVDGIIKHNVYHV